jgi:WD domain, G-beta repeat
MPTRASPDSVQSPRVGDNPAGLVDRPWLTSAVAAALADPDCRIVLLTGEMGTGKSTFVEGWNARHPASLLYSIRKDSHHRNRSGAANDLLEAIVRHFTGVFPRLFRPQGITISAAQDADEVAAAGSVTGIRIDELIGLPFAPLAIELVQLIGRVSGQVSGIEIGRYVTDPRLLATETLAELALLDPARSAGDSDQRLIIVIDALDELAAAGEGHAASIIGWLEDSPAFPPAVRFLISSRPGHHLDTLRQVHAESLREISLAGHVAEATGDIMRYCQHVLGESSDEPRRKRWIDELVGLARGNFLFVVLLLREFAEQGYVLSDHTAVLPSLASVPSELGGLYDLLLRKLRDRIGDEPVRLTGTGTYASAWSEVYEPVLGVLATAAAPLTIDQITAVADLRVQRESVRGALRKMASLLSSTKTGGTSAYSFVHQSLAQHLIGDETGSRSDFAVDASAWHSLIAASLWQGTGKQWLVEQDEYRVRHLGTHLRQCVPADGSAWQRLSALLRDPAFLTRKIEVAGVAAAMADIGAAVPLIPAGPHQETLQAIYDTLSVSQAALRAGADPLSTLVNGLTAENAAPATAEQAARLAELRDRPYIRLAQMLRMPRPPQRRQLGGFLDSLAGCAVDAQAAHILTASVDGQIRLWDRGTERELRAMQGGDMACSCAISADGAMLVAGYGDGLTAVWLDADEPILADRADSSVACVAANSADVVVAARLDGTLTVWQIDRADRRSRALWTADLGTPLHCCAIADSGTVIAGDGTGELHVISDAGTARWAAHPAPVRACAIYPDGRRAVTGSYDGTLAVWDLETGARHAALTGHDSAVVDCSLSRDASMLVSASLDGTSALWDPGQGAFAREMGPARRSRHLLRHRRWRPVGRDRVRR